MCQIISVDFKAKKIIKPSILDKVKQVVQWNQKDGFVGIVFSPSDYNLYTYGDTEFSHLELSAMIHHFQALGFKTKTGRDFDEENEEYTGDWFLDLEWEA